MPPASDEFLIARAASGDLAAFESIVCKYQSPLLHFISKRFPSRSDAQDILQDAFLKAWQSLHLYSSSYPFRTWLYTIAYRTAVSHGRKDDPAKPLPPFDLPDRNLSPLSSVEQEEASSHLWDTARKILSDEQFTALWLHYVEDIPANEIAKILNRSWVSVKTLMHRARKKLAPVLSPPSPAAQPMCLRTSQDGDL